MSQQDLEQQLREAWYESSVEFTKHLNVNEIHSHIRRYLTDAESERLINPDVSRDQKIKELMEFFPKKGGGWFENFMDALTKTKTCTGHETIITALDSKRPKDTFKELYRRKKFEVNVIQCTNMEDLKKQQLHVLIQTVSENEYCAVILQLKEGCKVVRYTEEGPNGSSYLVGKWGEAEIPVVIIQTDPGSNGLHGSYNETTRALERLPYLKYIFAVGVCGGVKDKVNLGDVIVSTFIQDYAFTILSDDKLTNCYSPWYIAKNNDFHHFINNKATNVKQGIVLSSSIGTNAAELGKLVDVFSDVIAYEMEGSGIANACGHMQKGEIGWMIVKGVSDLSDGNKTHDLQQQAALNAVKALYKALKKFVSYETMLAKLEKAKANKETVKVSYTTVMFCGSSGVGKTNLIKKLNKEDLKADHHSTGVAKSKHTVSIETVAVSKSAEGLQWINFNHDSMISQLNKLLFNLRSLSLSSTIESEKDTQIDLDTKSQDSQFPLLTTSPAISSSQDNIPSTSSSKIETNKEYGGDSPELDSVAVDIAKADSSNTPPLGEVWKVINFLDTGGQPEFVNVLPAVSNSIGLTFIVFNLSESLDDLVLVKHNVKGVPSFEPYHLDCTNLDLIKRLIALSKNFNKIATFKSIQMKGGEDYHSKICCLGTHALLENVSKENIQKTDNRLSNIIEELNLQKKFWSSPKPELTSLFPIDLFPPDKNKGSFDSIIQKIRDNIHDQVQGQGYYEVPITWFIFLLKLQRLCDTKKISFISYQNANDVWMDKNISKLELRAESNHGLLYKDQDKSIDRKNSDVHNILLFFHFMGMLFYYDIEGMRNFVFIDRQWLFNKLTELVKVKFTKGCNNISQNDVSKFKKEGILSINIIKNLEVDLQGIEPLHFIYLLDHLNIIAPIDAEAKEYFMPCVLDSFQLQKLSELDRFYGCIQRVPLLVKFRNGPIPHGFFCRLIVELIKKLPKGWVFLRQSRSMKHVYNNLITFHTNGGYAVSLFYKIENLEIQVRSKQPQPSVIHSNVQHELDIVLKKAVDNLELTNEQPCYGFYCECEEKHFAPILEDFSECTCIFCDDDSVDIKEDHRAWFQDIEDDKLQQGSSVIETDICANVKTKVKGNYEDLMKIRADAILPGLVAKEVITLEEKEIIDVKQLNREKMGYLIDAIIIPSLAVGILTKYKKFLEVLERNEDLTIKVVAQRLGCSKDLP